MSIVAGALEPPNQKLEQTHNCDVSYRLCWMRQMFIAKQILYNVWPFSLSQDLSWERND